MKNKNVNFGSRLEFTSCFDSQVSQMTIVWFKNTRLTDPSAKEMGLWIREDSLELPRFLAGGFGVCDKGKVEECKWLHTNYKV